MGWLSVPGKSISSCTAGLGLASPWIKVSRVFGVEPGLTGYLDVVEFKSFNLFSIWAGWQIMRST